MPIAEDSLPGFGLAVAPALPSAIALFARLLLPQFLLLFLLFLLNPRPPGAERLVGTREAFRIIIIIMMTII